MKLMFHFKNVLGGIGKVFCFWIPCRKCKKEKRNWKHTFSWWKCWTSSKSVRFIFPMKETLFSQFKKKINTFQSLNCLCKKKKVRKWPFPHWLWWVAVEFWIRRIASFYCESSKREFTRKLCCLHSVSRTMGKYIRAL